eukprot:EG_transcript_14088
MGRVGGGGSRDSSEGAHVKHVTHDCRRRVSGDTSHTGSMGRQGVADWTETRRGARGRKQIEGVMWGREHATSSPSEERDTWGHHGNRTVYGSFKMTAAPNRRCTSGTECTFGEARSTVVGGAWREGAWREGAWRGTSPNGERRHGVPVM